MTRFLLLMASALSIAAATLALQSCGAESVEAASSVRPANSLVVLPDGSTMAAATGSLSRRVSEWLANREGGSADFQFTGFHETQPTLTSKGLGRAADLATILRAAPAATIELAGDEAQATTLARLLEDRGIANERMRVIPAAGLGAVTMTIHRGTTAPLMTARR